MAARIGPYAVSIAFQGVLLALLAVSIRNPVIAQRSAAPQQVQPIQAVAIDSAKVDAEVQRLRAQQRQQQANENAKRRQLKDEAARLVELNRKRKAEAAQAQQQLARLKKEQAAVAQKRAAEQKRLEQLAAQRKMAQDQARKAEQARIKQQAVQDLKRQMAAEEKRLQQEQQTERAAADTRYRTQYVDDIANRVRRNWLRPPGATQDFSCTVLVQQIPTGDVIAVQITKSCGSPVLDRSVEDAVRKSSPLPLPPVQEVFDREIEFTFSSSSQ